MSREWNNWEDTGSFERFHKDRGIKKKQKRGDRHSQKQRMREATSDIDRFEDEAFEDYSNERTNPKQR